MKNIDKMIIEKYNNEQKNEIKNRMGFESKNEYESLSPKPKTRLFIPSIISLCVSLIFLITASLLLVVDNPQFSAPVTSYAEKHLKRETIDYIKRPVITLVDSTSDAIISIYYGVKGDALAEHSHYLVFEINSDKTINVDTEILSNGMSLWTYIFISGDQTNNFYSFETNYNLIDVRFTIGTDIQEITLDLTSYYDFLRK